VPIFSRREQIPARSRRLGRHRQPFTKAGMSKPHWPGHELRSLTELEAYDAMLAFLEAYWERGLKASDDIAVLLGSTQRLRNGMPLDSAQWDDWRDAVEMVVKHKPTEKLE
jgi:hypothetical protein